MTGLHETHLRVVSLRWTTNPNRQVPTVISVPQVLQLDNLSDPSRVKVVDHVQSFGRMVIPYVINFNEARTAGLVIRRPQLMPRYVRVDGQEDTFYDVVDWPAPEIYIWQATDDRLYYGRAADGVQVPLTSRSLNDVDLALSVTFRGSGLQPENTVIISGVVAIPVSG